MSSWIHASQLRLYESSRDRCYTDRFSAHMQKDKQTSGAGHSNKHLAHELHQSSGRRQSDKNTGTAQTL